MTKARRCEEAVDCIPEPEYGLPLPVLFDYTPEQWSAIESALHSLRPDSDAIDDIRYGLRRAANSYLLQVLERPKEQNRRRDAIKRWRNIEKHAIALIAEFEQEFGEEGRPSPDGNFHERQLYRLYTAAFDARVVARGRLTELADLIDDGFPKATPKVWYHGVVLSEWAALGGKLRVSHHPDTNKIKGPLVKYFSAVTEPVHGGSPETIPDILERHTTLCAEIERWRLQMIIEHGEPLMGKDDD
jgi:hypothetical protein